MRSVTAISQWWDLCSLTMFARMVLWQRVWLCRVWLWMSLLYLSDEIYGVWLLCLRGWSWQRDNVYGYVADCYMSQWWDLWSLLCLRGWCSDNVYGYVTAISQWWDLWSLLCLRGWCSDSVYGYVTAISLYLSDETCGVYYVCADGPLKTCMVMSLLYLSDETCGVYYVCTDGPLTTCMVMSLLYLSDETCGVYYVCADGPLKTCMVMSLLYLSDEICGVHYVCTDGPLKTCLVMLKDWSFNRHLWAGRKWRVSTVSWHAHGVQHVKRCTFQRLCVVSLKARVFSTAPAPVKHLHPMNCARNERWH